MQSDLDFGDENNIAIFITLIIFQILKFKVFQYEGMIKSYEKRNVVYLLHK